jgi:hypothetical protein
MLVWPHVLDAAHRRRSGCVMSWEICTPGEPTRAEVNRAYDEGMFGDWGDDEINTHPTFAHAVTLDWRITMAGVTWSMVVEHVATCGDRARWPFRTVPFQAYPRR